MIMFVYVVGPPEFRVEPHNTIIEQGNTLLMNCVAEGEPTPVITWRKEREVLASHDRLTIMPNNSLRYKPTNHL